MAFKLTPDHVRSIFDPCAEGNLDPFIEAVDPEVQWIVGDPEPNPLTKAGTYNLQSWKNTIAKAFSTRLQTPLAMKVTELDVIGQKVIMECVGSATQKNGKPYNNRYCWILIFSEETGKIIKIREYMNTALVKEVIETNDD